jgi:hypothetical protein
MYVRYKVLSAIPVNEESVEFFHHLLLTDVNVSPNYIVPPNVHSEQEDHQADVGRRWGDEPIRIVLTEAPCVATCCAGMTE